MIFITFYFLPLAAAQEVKPFALPYHITKIFTLPVTLFKPLNLIAQVDGRECLNEVFPIDVDTVFNNYFNDSKFFRDFHDSKKSFGR